MENPHYRAGVGTVIYNQNHEVALFRRCVPPVGTWQFQQGGIDAGEVLETTLWRELLEETGLSEADIVTTTPYPTATVQTYPPEILQLPDQPNPLRLGQVHRWYFLELKPEINIDLNKAHDEEFDDWKWVSWEEALAVPPSYKVHVYQELYEYFKNHLVGLSK
jgi:putative (di)nucleoside polyphosphate hydrolase